MLIQINWNPDRKQLRTFGVVVLAGFLIIGALMARFKFHSMTPFYVCASAGGVMAVCAIFLPPVGLVLYKGWVGFGFCLGMVLTPIFIGLIYFGMFTPIGLLLRVLGKDTMQRRKVPLDGSYWKKVAHRTDLKSYERQF